MTPRADMLCTPEIIPDRHGYPILKECEQALPEP